MLSVPKDKVVDLLNKQDVNEGKEPHDGFIENEMLQGGEEYLFELNAQFPPCPINLKTLRESSKNKKFTIYSREASTIKNYFEVTLPKENLTKETSAKLFGSQVRPSSNQIGLIIGNGFILSLLPEIPVKNILLLANEPAVHYFILEVRKMIVEVDETESFDSIKGEIIRKMIYLENRIDPHSTKILTDHIVAEMNELKDLHFLSNFDRFKRCKKSLQEKKLAPMVVNLLKQEDINCLSTILKKYAKEIKYLNLSNLVDYDKDHVLQEILTKLPFAKNFAIISTSMVHIDSKMFFPDKAFYSTTPDEVREALAYNYWRNTEYIRYDMSGYVVGGALFRSSA